MDTKASYSAAPVVEKTDCFKVEDVVPQCCVRSALIPAELQPQGLILRDID